MAEQNDDEGDDSVDGSAMGEYAKAVQLRLQEEVKPTTTCQLYLLLMLKNDDWVLPACHAKKICDLLKPARTPISTLLSADDEPQQPGMSIISPSKTAVIPSRTVFIPFGQHPPITAATHPTPENGILIVGGTIVSNYEPLVLDTSKGPRKRGDRHHDLKQRAARHCKTCKSSGRSDNEAMSCSGANSMWRCKFAPNPAPTSVLPIVDPSVM